MLDQDFFTLNVAVLTVSDSRTSDTDHSGDYLVEALTGMGHTLVDRSLVKDDVFRIRADLSGWIARNDVQVVLITGGTGCAARDVTPEALAPLLTRTIDGFGELFRMLSYQDIGSATVQSRALAGVANGTLIFALPGSTGACKLGFEKILKEQLDARHKPCNFVSLFLPPPSSNQTT